MTPTTFNAFKPSNPTFALPGKPYKKNLALVDIPMARANRNPVSNLVYNLFLKRQSTYLVLVGGLAFGYDYLLDSAFDWHISEYNKGRTYEDVIATFPEIPPDCDEDE